MLERHFHRLDIHSCCLTVPEHSLDITNGLIHLSTNKARVVQVTIHQLDYWATAAIATRQSKVVVKAVHCTSARVLVQCKYSKQRPVHSHHLHCIVLHDQPMTSHHETRFVSLSPVSPSHLCTIIHSETVKTISFNRMYVCMYGIVMFTRSNIEITVMSMLMKRMLCRRERSSVDDKMMFGLMTGHAVTPERFPCRPSNHSKTAQTVTCRPSDRIS